MIYHMTQFHFIDRRKNPRGKSLGNRQRFLKRAKAQIKEAVNKSLRDRSVKELDKGEKISIPSKSTKEPRFRLNPDSGRKKGRSSRQQGIRRGRPHQKAAETGRQGRRQGRLGFRRQ